MEDNFLSKQEQMEEYLKCGLDFEYTAEKYFKVENKNLNKYIPFKLLSHQKKLLKFYEQGGNVITNKYRQAGITTFTTAYFAWLIVFTKNTKLAVIANTLDLAKEELFKKIFDFINCLPEYMLPELLKSTEKLKIFSNGSQMTARAASKNGLRGFSPTHVLLDEWAHLEYGQEFWTAARPSISMGGRILGISTPNGRSNLFYEIFDGAKNKQNDFVPVELKWYHDDRLISDLEWVLGNERIVEFDHEKQKELLKRGYKPTSSWFRKECSGLSNNKKRIAQELEGEFIGSGGTVIDDEDILRHELSITDPISYENFDRNFWIWKHPEPDRKYIFGVDVSLGSSEDYSTICVLDIESREQVAEYQGKVQPDVLGEIVNLFGTKYNNAYIVVDVTGGVGVTTVTKLLEMGYTNLYYGTTRDTKIRERLMNYVKYDNTVPGFQIGANRVELVYELERSFRSDEIIVHSSRLISELKTFVMINGRADHTRSSHDDLIWALIMAMYVSQTNISKINKGSELSKSIIDSWVIQDFSTQKDDYMGITQPKNKNKFDNQDFGFFVLK